MANVRENLNPAKLPAGLIGEEEEAFWVENDPIDKKWIAINGVVKRFCDWPLKVRNQWCMHYFNDTENRDYIENRLKLKGFQEPFERWWKCVHGGFDSVPDVKNGKICPDAYNNMCTERNCPDRGKLCGKISKLNNQDVQTLSALTQGETFRNTADYLYISEAGLKSRVTKLRQKLEAKNTPALTARAAQIGI